MSGRSGDGGGGSAGVRAEAGVGVTPPGSPAGVAADRPEQPSRVPVVSMVLMAIFLVGGSVGLLADWPAGPGNLDWGVWVILYGGYGYVISAAIFHALTGR